MNSVSSVVLLDRCDRYHRSMLAPMVDAMITALKGDADFHGRAVMLKPNLISVIAPSFGCTHGEFLCAVASCFLDRGAKVRLGDSPAFGSAAAVLRKMGIKRTLEAMNVELVEFVTPMAKILQGKVRVVVAAEALECDMFVGLPKVKAHNQMYMTLALKNIFGILKGTRKAQLHMTQGQSHRRFAQMILDLLPLLPEQIHLVDGITAMHRTGPLHGEPFNLRCIAGSVNPVALDSALLALLELDCRKSPLWQVAKARKMTGCSVADLIFPHLSPGDFSGLGFIAPKELNPVRFNPLRFLRGVVKRMSAGT